MEKEREAAAGEIINVCSDMSGVWRGRRLETGRRSHHSSPPGVPQSRVSASSGVSGADCHECSRDPGMAHDGIGLSDAGRRQDVGIRNPAHDIAGMSCASRDGDPELAPARTTRMAVRSCPTRRHTEVAAR